jgi:hypothetical protein
MSGAFKVILAMVELRGGDSRRLSRTGEASLMYEEMVRSLFTLGRQIRTADRPEIYALFNLAGNRERL